MKSSAMLMSTLVWIGSVFCGGTPADALEYRGVLPFDGGFADVGIGDVDGNGYQDLIVLDNTYGSDRVLVYRNLGGLAFGAPDSYTVEGSEASHLGVEDMNGDGDVDMVVVTSRYVYTEWSRTGGINFFTNDGTGTFSLTQFEEESYGVSDMVLGDFDGDGDTDVTQTSDYDHTSRVVFNDALAGGASGRSGCE